jgi:gliding motility-associated-like protein
VTFSESSVEGNCTGTYILTRTWTATDLCGNASSHVQTINVQDTTAPVIAALPTTSTIDCPAIPVFAIATASDACGSAFTLTSTDVTTNGSCVSSYSVTRIWTATDACGNTSTASQTINVEDKIAPVITALPAASTIACPATPNFAIATATDACGSGATLTFADVTTQGSCEGSYSITRTWTATDACGNTSTASQTINVTDTKAPTTTTIFAAEINVNCNAIPVKPNLVFVDDCSTVAPTVVYTENTINTTATSYSIIRKWIVKDACNNISEFIQAVNVAVVSTNIAITEIKSYNIDDIPTPTINLFSLLPQGTPSGGTWFSENSSVILNGGIVDNSTVSEGNYKFTYTIDANACPTVFTLTVKIEGGIVLACGTVLVHNAFSPNGDGVNEMFTIDNLEDAICYPENTVEIYNRWGVLVFETKGYNNSTNAFNGTSRGRTTVSQSSGLPTGTYFYILNYTSVDGTGQIQTNKRDGYLYLTK